MRPDRFSNHHSKQYFWPRYEDGVHFVARTLPRDKLADSNTRVLEVGSFHPLGGYRSIVHLCAGAPEYIGVDIQEGPGVDVVCSGEDIVAVFGSDSFDVVIATELLEHIKDWRVLVSNMKNACKPGGTIIITTRSRGYGYHAAPFDYWRFEVGDIARIFVDCELLSIEEDPAAPGVFAAFKKPSEFSESDLSDVQLYSIVTGKRSADIKPDDLRGLHFALQYIGSKIRHLGIWAFSFGRKDVYAKFVKQFKEIAELVKTSKSSKETR